MNATVRGMDYKLFTTYKDATGKTVSHLIGTYSGWVDKPGTLREARVTAYAMLAEIRERHPECRFWIVPEVRYLIPAVLPPHSRPEDDPCVCWVFDMNNYGEAVALLMHPTL